MKRLFGKRALCGFLAAALAVSAAGCSKGDEKTTSEQIKNADIMKGTLSVYYVDDGKSNSFPELLLSGLETYNRNLKLKPTAFKNQDDFMKQTTTELGSGGGPDLFLLDYSTQMSFQKMSKNGTYLDLSSFLKDDKSYKPEEYYEAAVKAGQLDGKQRMLPLLFTSFNLITSEQKMKTSGVSLSEKSSAKEVLQALAAALKSKKNSSLIPVFPFVGRDDFPSLLLTGLNVQSANVQNHKITLEKGMCRAVSDLSRDWMPEIEKLKQNTSRSPFSSTKDYSEIPYVLDNVNFIPLYNLIKRLDKMSGQKTVILPLPSADKGKPTGEVLYYAAVNANSKNKPLAYSAARSLMDIPVDKNQLQTRLGFPVRRALLKNYLDLGISANSPVTIDGRSVSTHYDEKTNSEILGMVDRVQDITVEEYSIEKIIDDGLSDYVNGSTSDFDDCWSKMTNKLQLYTNE